MDPNIISLIIVAIVVILFLYREHRKSGKYFGKKHYLNKKQKKQLERFKQIYTPISNPDNFPSIKSHGYEFEDVALSAQTIPYDPPIPEPSEIESIKTKDNVKIVIIDKYEESQRVWVEISRSAYPDFDGILLNAPFDIEELKESHKIKIHSNHILQIGHHRK